MAGNQQRIPQRVQEYFRTVTVFNQDYEVFLKEEMPTRRRNAVRVTTFDKELADLEKSFETALNAREQLRESDFRHPRVAKIDREMSEKADALADILRIWLDVANRGGFREQLTNSHRYAEED